MYILKCSLGEPPSISTIPVSDHDDNDTDTENWVPNEQRRVIFAEVMYAFRAAGPQELSLQRGALVEVQRIEPGPWWWGRIKHDAILTDKLNGKLEGWFPKDFVRVIEPFSRPMTNARSKQRSLESRDSPNDNCDIDFLPKNLIQLLETSKTPMP